MIAASWRLYSDMCFRLTESKVLCNDSLAARRDLKQVGFFLGHDVCLKPHRRINDVRYLIPALQDAADPIATAINMSNQVWML
jgi:hypothetical protein